MDRRHCLHLLHGLCAAGLLNSTAQANPPASLPKGMPAPAASRPEMLPPASTTPPSRQEYLPASKAATQVVVPASARQEMLPPAETVKPATTSLVVENSREIPIGLDTVMRMADVQNAQLGRARYKVDQAVGEMHLAARKWFPDLNVGLNYYRHEGGIQDENGDFIRSSTGAILNGLEIHGVLDIREYAYQKVMAERNAWQQRGELSRLSYETLLDATSTYIDLVAARHAEQIARRLHSDLVDLENKAQKLFEVEKGAEVELVRVRSERLGREQLIYKLQAQAEAASAKLVYLLGLDPCVKLVPVDQVLVPISLVDASPETCVLVEQALDQGPGIRELASMLALVNDAAERAKGPSQYLPVVELRVLEGGFGAGPGSELDWANRMDAIVQVRWNLGALATSKDRQKIADAQRMQVHLAYDDLRGKLTAGVHEARHSILLGHQEIQIAGSQAGHAGRSRQLSRNRLDNNVAGSSYSEVLLSMQTLGVAEINHLNSIREYDKAQLRLLFLLGGQPDCLPAPAPQPAAPAAESIGQPKESEPAKP